MDGQMTRKGTVRCDVGPHDPFEPEAAMIGVRKYMLIGEETEVAVCCRDGWKLRFLVDWIKGLDWCGIAATRYTHPRTDVHLGDGV